MKLALFLFALSLLVSFTFLTPSVRKSMKNLLIGSDKQVLSQVEMEHQGNQYKIIKVQKPGSLAVELYKKMGEEFLFLDSHLLRDKTDAFYKFQEARYNLFLKDLNGDGQVEIILPSLDQNMAARLNIFHFDPIQEKLVKLSWP